MQDLDPHTATLLVFYGIDTIANIVSPSRDISTNVSHGFCAQSVAGHPVAWVNNQFQQYVFDITELVASPVNNDTNVTVAFESAWHYGLNVTARPDVEFISGDNVSTTRIITSSDADYVAHLTLQFEYPGVRQLVRKTQSDFGWDWVRSSTL